MESAAYIMILAMRMTGGFTHTSDRKLKKKTEVKIMDSVSMKLYEFLRIAVLTIFAVTHGI